MIGEITSKTAENTEHPYKPENVGVLFRKAKIKKCHGEIIL